MQLAGFKHIPGKHCGSTALRNVTVFFHHDYLKDFDLTSEANCFGLGAGMGFCYGFANDAPHNYLMGRALLLTEAYLKNLKVPHKIHEFNTPTELVEHTQKRLQQGLPTILQSDVHFLPYYNSPLHFTGHVFVVIGEENSHFITSDTHFKEPQSADFDAVKQAVSYASPLFRGINKCFDIDGGPELTKNELGDAIMASLRQTVHNYVETLDQNLLKENDFFKEADLGYKGLQNFKESFAENYLSSPNQVDDAMFLYQVIERRGTGGGAFRLMMAEYLNNTAGFLGHPQLKQQAELCLTLGTRWQEFAGCFRALYLQKGADTVEGSAAQNKAFALARELAEREEDLIKNLDEIAA